MENMNPTFAITIGLILRIGIPVVITVAAIIILRKIDAHWQEEAEKLPPEVTVEKPHCWDVKNCTPQQMQECPSPTSSQPCWQVHRQKNGYLREDCLTCEVFLQAPLPTPVQPTHPVHP